MALIRCPECRKEISDKATRCPNCGFPLPINRNDSKKDSKKKELEYNKFIVGMNTVIGVLGSIMIYAIFISKGGIAENLNIMIVAAGMVVGSIVSIISICKRNKILTYILVVPYAFAVSRSLALISYRPAYLILEFVIGATALLTVWNAKKSNILN